MPETTEALKVVFIIIGGAAGLAALITGFAVYMAKKVLKEE
jgi:hypothetical protein